MSLSKSCIAARSRSPEQYIRQRFDVILVVNDVLHTIKYHSPSHPSHADEWAPYVEELVALVASCLHDKDGSLEERLKAIVKYWRANELLPIQHLNSIVEKTRTTLRIAQGDALPEPEKRIHTLPDWFGDRNVPWHDLPASYIVHPLIERPRDAIDSVDLKPIRFTKKHPSQKTSDLLDEYFENIHALYAPTKSNPTGEKGEHKLFYDSTGHVAKRAADVEDLNILSNGYGWSTEMCESMDEHGLPESVLKAREANGARERDEEKSRRTQYDSDGSRWPRRHRRSHSSSSSPRQRRSRSRSYDSHDSRSSSRHSNIQYRDRRGSPRYDGRDNERPLSSHKPPPAPLAQQQSNSNWQMSNPRSSSFDGSSERPVFNNGYGQSFAPNSGPTTAPPFPGPPIHVPGHFPNMPFQPPFPGAMPGMPPPPPPPLNFDGPFPGGFPPPPVSGFPNTGYGNFGGNNGFNNDAGYGGFNQGFQGNGFNARGGFGRGRGGGGSSRWH